MIDPAAFLAAILANPDDAGLRLIFADWLEDQGIAGSIVYDPST